jgi:hypothetical protein
MKLAVTLVIDGPDSETIEDELDGAIEFLHLGERVTVSVTERKNLP